MAFAARQRQHVTPPVPAPVDAEGVAYFEIVAGGASVRMFRCEPHRANLTPRGCADRWRDAQTATGAHADAMSVCRGCPIGAAHAGERPVHYSWLFGQAICPRCSASLDAASTDRRPGGRRMIGDRLCVSCYNRQRELEAGRNARGNTPVKLLASRPRVYEITRLVDGEPSHLHELAVGPLELMVHTLRTTKGAIAFGRRQPAARYAAHRSFAFVGATSGLRQGRLF